MASYEEAVPSNRLVQSSVAAVTTTETSATKKKEVVCTFDGTYRFKFGLKTAAITDGANAQLYKNGVAIGIPRNTTSTDPVVYVEDIGGWKRGDLMQLYIWSTAGSQTVTATGFSIWAEIQRVGPAIPAGKVNLA